MQDLQRDLDAVGIPRQVDSRVAAFADLPLDSVAAFEGLANQRQHVTGNATVLCGGYPMVASSPDIAQDAAKLKQEIASNSAPHAPPQ